MDRAPTLISCPTCAADLPKDYWMARQIKKDYTKFYLWMCQFCGQEIMEKMKLPIHLN